MKVVIVEPNKPAYVAEIENDYRIISKIIDGPIQIAPFFSDAMILCNEDGKIENLPITAYFSFGDDCSDVIVGTFIICGIDGDDFASLSDDLCLKYTELFKEPFDTKKALHELQRDNIL